MAVSLSFLPLCFLRLHQLRRHLPLAGEDSSYRRAACRNSAAATSQSVPKKTVTPIGKP